MPRARLGFAGAALAFLAVSVAATRYHAPKLPVVTREVIAVYLGTEGTDARSGMIAAVRDMQTALRRQTASMGARFIARGVSLEPGIQDGIRHLALFSSFDEISVGGNWTNSSVVHYLGGDMGNHKPALIPQVVVLEREIRRDGPQNMVVGPEKEIGRYIGTDTISKWVQAGAPIPR